MFKNMAVSGLAVRVQTEGDMIRLVLSAYPDAHLDCNAFYEGRGVVARVDIVDKIYFPYLVKFE